MSKLISVIVPCYNVGKFIPSFFKAMDGQTFKDFCLFFVYDKSQDDTLVQLNNQIKSHPCINSMILYSPEKKGLGAARDFALDSGLMDGEYFISLDPDDTAHSDFFEKLISTALSTNADITFCGFRRVDFETGSTIAIDMVHNPKQVVVTPDNAFRLTFCNSSTWNKLIKFTALNGCRYIYPGGSGEDALFYCKIVPFCHLIAFINEVLIDYSIRKDSFASGTNESSFEKAKQGFLDVKDFYKEHSKTHLPYNNFLYAVAYLRIGIGMTTRCSISNKKNRRRIIRSSKQFLDQNFTGWQKNPFLSLRKCFSAGKKTMLVYQTKILYKIHCFSLFVLTYNLFTKCFHKDIKY